jgi:hypothetical protein
MEAQASIKHDHADSNTSGANTGKFRLIGAFQKLWGKGRCNVSFMNVPLPSRIMVATNAE